MEYPEIEKLAQDLELFFQSNQASSECPGEDLVLMYQSGFLSVAEEKIVREHFASCRFCLEKLTQKINIPAAREIAVLRSQSKRAKRETPSSTPEFETSKFRNQILLVTSLLSLLFVGLLSVLRTQLSEQTKRSQFLAQQYKNLKEEQTKNFAALKKEIIPSALSVSVPLGAIVDWHRFNDKQEIPLGFQLCDGGEISDKESPFFGQKTPDLVDKFVMGATLESEGKKGGENTLELARNYQILFKETDQVRGVGGQSDIISVPFDNAAQEEQNFYAKISPRPLKSAKMDNRPAYVSVLKIIRIK